MTTEPQIGNLYKTIFVSTAFRGRKKVPSVCFLDIESNAYIYNNDDPIYHAPLLLVDVQDKPYKKRYGFQQHLVDLVFLYAATGKLYMARAIVPSRAFLLFLTMDVEAA